MWWCRFESKFWLPLVRCQPICHTIKHSNNLCRNLFRTRSLFRTWICKHSGFRNFHSAKCCGEPNFIQLFFNTIIFLSSYLGSVGPCSILTLFIWLLCTYMIRSERVRVCEFLFSFRQNHTGCSADCRTKVRLWAKYKFLAKVKFNRTLNMRYTLEQSCCKKQQKKSKARNWFGK